MKKLDKLILRAFAGPFLLTLAVVQFILLTQYMLKYLDDLVGKDLGVAIISQLLFYFSVLMVPISLPLAVLLSSLMTYGTLGEHHELTAIKTSGISLTRILRPVLLVALALAGFSFWFNDNIVPKANLSAYSLLWDLRQQKLALDIREGVFYNGIPGYTIKVNQKLGEDGDVLMGVMIYDHTNGRGNSTVILADSGRMFTRFGGQYLGLELFRGTMYVEQPDARDRAGASFIREAFDRNTITFSLASFDLNRTKETLFAENKMMKNILQLRNYTDSLHNRLLLERRQLTQQFTPYYTYLRFDTTGQAQARRVEGWKVPNTKLPAVNAQFIEQATNRARNVRAYAGSTGERLANLSKEAGNFRIEIYRKYVQAVAVLLMFLIGAPLGAIIKKGGLGVPVLISIVFFIIYYVLSIMGEKYGREGVMPVGIGMWMSTGLLLPAGLVFLNQARRDSGLLEWDFRRLLPARLRWPFRGYKRSV
ncbi:lipopolysaccharide export system permease protein [Hymenobacter daecheongensis DSM 21074]|uniref:Lipopolysaccharide export system permease protein n=1 Tax=Hymenobacter daecheongensis DSM 21074 TaxID=1121955 RepID=A0A1M6K544_9BACT|nr:LptF/LptG family permease [Hymenobacter daecheongensis]SHJ54037.1 lipopolysaccharide export system permease protein [Hymenobacter daecheongensis DSM 21074]